MGRDELLDSRLVEEAAESLRVGESLLEVEYTTGKVAKINTGEGVDFTSVTTKADERGVDGSSVQKGKNNVVKTESSETRSAVPVGKETLVARSVLESLLGPLNTEEGEQILLIEVESVVAVLIRRVVGSKLSDEPLGRGGDNETSEGRLEEERVGLDRLVPSV